MSGFLDFPSATTNPQSSSNSRPDEHEGARNLTDLSRPPTEQIQQLLEHTNEARRYWSPLSPYMPPNYSPRRRRQSASAGTRANGNAAGHRGGGQGSDRSAPTPPPATDPPTSDVREVRRRPRATPGDRIPALRRQRLQREQQLASLGTLAEVGQIRSTRLAELEQAGQRLAQISSDIGELLEPPMPLPLPPGGSPTGPLGSFGGETDVSRRRSKRRKLEVDGDTPSFKGFKYGHYGQVVPGRLKMEIVSCDGGEHPENMLEAYVPENVLKNDSSVYCTASSCCNLMLQHQGNTTFCLEKVVVKAPRQNFNAPVQEGLIFVSMTKESLEQGTSRYQIHYTPPATLSNPESTTSSQDNEPLTLLQSLRDPLINRAARRHAARDRDAEYSSYMYRLSRRYRQQEWDLGEPPVAATSRNRGERDGNGNPVGGADNCDWPLVDPTTPHGADEPAPPPFTVTMGSDSESDDHGGDTDDERRTTMHALHRANDRLFVAWDDDSDSEGGMGGNVPNGSADLLMNMNLGRDGHASATASRPFAVYAAPPAPERQHPHPPPATYNAPPPGPPAPSQLRPWRRTGPSRIEASTGIAGGAPAATLALSDANAPGGPTITPGELSRVTGPDGGPVLLPHARFFIEKHRSRITVRFDPPVSGKYLLLKLFSPYKHGNIDVKYVAAHGFAGPRYLPSCELR